jgi:hypothetical protein
MEITWHKKVQEKSKREKIPVKKNKTLHAKLRCFEIFYTILSIFLVVLQFEFLCEPLRHLLCGLCGFRI